ncbi:hypothetical protein BGC31_05635 [Komagataeibacter xylinus]|nr:hypothetical protein H845_707 [Komagataeibacter xylinus E25]RFP05634.1 hypothetical protein BGC31_05635 [Komagataeibacter xylinus]
MVEGDRVFRAQVRQPAIGQVGGQFGNALQGDFGLGHGWQRLQDPFQWSARIKQHQHRATGGWGGQSRKKQHAGR